VGGKGRLETSRSTGFRKIFTELSTLLFPITHVHMSYNTQVNVLQTFTQKPSDIKSWLPKKR